MSWKRWIHEIRYAVRIISPLHIGSEDDELLIDEDGRAMIPGTSLAGAFRAYIQQRYPDRVDRLFGNQSNDSDLYVHDLISERIVPFEERPSVRIDGAMGSAADKGKFERAFVAKNETFIGKLIWTEDDQVDQEKNQIQYIEVIKEMLSALHFGYIRLGKFKSVGSGQVEIIQIRHQAYDCFKPDDYFQFLQESQREESSNDAIAQWGNDEKTNWLKDQLPASICQFKFQLSTASPMIIRGNDISLAGEPDISPIRDAEGNYIIPGSSWKGILRHQASKIAHYYGVSELVKKIFGSSPGCDKEVRTAGNVYVSDSVIKNSTTTDYSSIRIDRLTGGVREGAMKWERTVQGDAELRLDVMLDPLKLDESERRMIKGLLLLTLRDLAEQGMTLGGGFANGRGRLSGHQLTIQEDQLKIVIDFSQEKGEHIEEAHEWIAELSRRKTG